MRKIIVSLVGVIPFVTFGAETSFGAAKGTARPFRASASGIGVVTGGSYVIDGTSKGLTWVRALFIPKVFLAAAI